MKIPIDKQYHLFAGFCIYLIASLFMPTIPAMIPVIVIGTGKEVWDYVNMEGTPDINDLLYTIYGALPLFILKLIIS
jgi:hypothetical protein